MTGPPAGLPWTDVTVGTQTVSVFRGFPRHFYALDPTTGSVVSGRTLDAVVERLRAHVG